MQTEQLTPELKAAFEAILQEAFGSRIGVPPTISVDDIYNIMLAAHNYHPPLPETLTLQFEQIINNMPQEGQFTLHWLCELMGKARDMDRWVDVKERLPEESGDVIIYGRFTSDCPKESMEAYYGNRGKNFRIQGIKSKDVTHWQPLPNPPTQAVRKDGEG